MRRRKVNPNDPYRVRENDSSAPNIISPSVDQKLVDSIMSPPQQPQTPAPPKQPTSSLHPNQNTGDDITQGGQQLFQAPPNIPIQQTPENIVPENKPKKNKMIIFLIVSFLVLVVLTVAALLLVPKKKGTKSQDNQTATQQPQSPVKPAEAIDVEQTNNSVNQDISGLNIDEDFPTTQMEDKALGL